jgi:hypothetical protein
LRKSREKAARAREIEHAIKQHDKRKDEHAGQPLDKLLTALDEIGGMCRDFGKRLDALEGKHLPSPGAHHRGKGEIVPAEPGEPPGSPKAVIADAARRQSEAAQLADAQVLADTACSAWGSSAPRPMAGEALLDYRRRLLRPWVKYSQEFGSVNVDELTEPLLGPIERKIFADAVAASNNPSVAPEGVLREVRRRDESGREIVSFFGEPKTWMRQFSGQRRRLAFIRTSTP